MKILRKAQNALQINRNMYQGCNYVSPPRTVTSDIRGNVIKFVEARYNYVLSLFVTFTGKLSFMVTRLSLFVLLVLFCRFSADAQCWSHVAPGWFHNVAIQTDGTLWAWGRNNFGQLGDGSNIDRTSPVQIGADNDWIFTDSGDYHSIAVKSDGTLWAWGQNDSGQLGDGTFTNRNAPTKIGTDSDWHTVSLGTKFTLALKINGELWGWGQTGSNQLGTGNSALNQNVPVHVGTAVGWQHVTAGANFGLAIKENGTLWGWGDHNNAALANGQITGSTLHPTQTGIATNWAALATGNTTTLALKAGHTLWSWGGNTFGALGTGAASNDPSESPVQVGNDADWNYISMGRYHSYGVKLDKSLWIWGRNNGGQIGDGTTVDRFTPMQVATGTQWQKASGGDQHTIAISEDNSLWSWGGNAYGQLGNGTTINSIIPTSIGMPCTLAIPAATKRSIIISPNPVTDIFTVSHLPTGPDVTISIINLLGQTLASYPIPSNESSVTLFVHGYQPGIYIVRIISAHSRYSTKITIK